MTVYGKYHSASLDIFISFNFKIVCRVHDRGAASAGNFAETSPGDLIAPPYQTEVLVTYDDDHLYLAFLVADEPGDVRSTMCDRDAIFQDDYVGIILDTYGDQAWSYEFLVNPIGTRADLAYPRPKGARNSLAWNPDPDWEAATRIGPDAWTVEVRIPFAAILDWKYPPQPGESFRLKLS